MNLKKLLEKLVKKNCSKNGSDKNNISNLIILFLIGVLIVTVVSFFNTSNVFSIQNSSYADNNKSSNNKNDVSSSSVSQQSSNSEDSEDYETEVQDKLKQTLEEIDGVGRVEVMVTFESGQEQVPAVNINDSTSTTVEKDTQGGTRDTTQKNNDSTVVITNDGTKSQPLIVKTYKPKVSGVIVVAEGAENKLTELRISKAVVDLFGIPDDKVNVYPMKK